MKFGNKHIVSFACIVTIILFFISCRSVNLRYDVDRTDINGLKAGLWINYIDSLNQIEFVHYKKGKKDGLYVRYYSNGLRAITGTYNNDQRIRKWCIYNSNGQMVGKEFYINGRLIKRTQYVPNF